MYCCRCLPTASIFSFASNLLCSKKKKSAASRRRNKNKCTRRDEGSGKNKSRQRDSDAHSPPASLSQALSLTPPPPRPGTHRSPRKESRDRFYFHFISKSPRGHRCARQAGTGPQCSTKSGSRERGKGTTEPVPAKPQISNRRAVPALCAASTWAHLPVLSHDGDVDVLGDVLHHVLIV